MKSPVSLIIHTDLDTDCDDVGAIAVAHALQTRGHIDVKAIICSAPVAWCAPFASMLNEAAGRADVPLGAYSLRAQSRSPRFDGYDHHRREIGLRRPDALYNETLAGERFGDRPPDFPNAVDVYRRVLAQAADGTVVICAIGALSALADLLDSPADAISPLPGETLVAAKVRRLVTMAGGVYPSGRDGFNWAVEKQSAARVPNHWPTELAVSSAGDDVLTGATYSRGLPADNLFRRAYECYLGGPGRSRCSWDQIALLYASEAFGSCFEEITGKGLIFDEVSGKHEWSDRRDGPERRYITPSLSSTEMAALIEELMIEGAMPPGRRESGG